MTSLKLALYLTCLCLWRIGKFAWTTDVQLSTSVRQESGFISANVGDNVTLQCFFQCNETGVFSWYKQTLGQKPRIVSTYFEHDAKGTFTDEFKNNPRFTLETKKGKNHLTISNLQTSESATYYCVVSCHAYEFEFKEGFTVSVEGSGLNIPASVHQSASESIQPGGSVTLNCTVHTGTCDGEHSVYWFKTSEESHPGLIYTHGGRNDQCERKPNTQTHTCVYNLPMQSLNLSHAGTYYCAVASCGHILFGDGTNMDIKNAENSPDSLVYFLSGALAFTTLLVVLLTVSVYKMNRRSSCLCRELQRVSASTTTNGEGNQDADNLHYAALSVNHPNRPRRQRNHTKDECVYSGVRQ
uniref:Ig-like domain-containing protein n=1 Tax=Dicentrarchus labrax TaxID=13489 RepID=A0A8C4H0F1_DICLA